MKKIILLILLIACISIVYFLYVDTSDPVISWDIRDNHFVNSAFTVTVTDNRSLDEVCFTLSGGACKNSQTCESALQNQSFDLVIDPEKCAEGSDPFALEVTVNAKDSFFLANQSSETIQLTYDRQAPHVVTLAGTRYMKRGGTGVVLYEVNEMPAETGILLDDQLFRSFEFEPNKFVSFYAHPYYVEPDNFKPRIFATDKADNLKKIRPGSSTASRHYKAEVITLTDDFLENVKNKIMASSTLSDLDAFVEINNKVRAENNQRIIQICQETEPAKLWEGAFLRNLGATKAGFADSRTYKYQSKIVGQQTHTGIDIAAVNNTEIVAANHGRVVFTGELGIYGTVIIIDHGFGLHSLYGHLNQVLVQDGDEVRKAAPIGISGETGLAFGDHLHFEIRVSGVPVNPIEWFDQTWVHNNIEVPLVKIDGNPKEPASPSG